MDTLLLFFFQLLYYCYTSKLFEARMFEYDIDIN